MLSLKNYVRAQSLEQAYTLCQKKRNVVLGGMVWLKMMDMSYDTAIDLSELGLDAIEEDETAFRIGAMTTLRALETSAALNAYTNGAMAEAVRHIVGVQFRNCATVGGSVFGRYGFSDVITLLLALDAQVELYGAGVLPLAEFLNRPRTERDLLVHILLPKTVQRVVYLSQRNSATDFPTLTCAAAQVEGRWQCAVGARPGVARLVRDEAGLLGKGFDAAQARAFAEQAAQGLPFGSNTRAGAAYRQQLCRVLVRRALMQAQEG